MVEVYLHWRVANDEVSADDVTPDSRLQKQTIRIPDDCILLNDVVVGARTTL